MQQYKMLINGQWVDSLSGKTIIRECPATGEPIIEFPCAGVEDTRLAIKAARDTFDSGVWREKSPSERAAVLLKAASIMKTRAEELAHLESRDVGNPYNAINWAGYYAADVFEYFAGLIRNHCGRTIDMGPKFMGMTILEPIGVVGLVTPWNFPLPMASWKLAPALAVGCSVVIKPSELTPSSTLVLGEILMEAGVPAGVINVVTGYGNEVGVELSSNPMVDKMAATGSMRTGKSIIENSIKDIKRVSLELGGKSPNIICEDADLDAAINGALGVFNNAGQVCNAPTRLLVQESIAEEVIDRLVTIAKGMKLGLPNDDTVNMGPVISPIHMERVLGFIERGIKEGATLACGGHRVMSNGLDKGNFIEPTIFIDVNSNMEIAREEIFGPVLVVQTFKTVEEAIKIANDNQYGLASGVWTNSMDKLNAIVRGLKAGTVWVNTWGNTVPELPNGGYKHSGYGRELGPESLESYIQVKSVHLCTK